MKQAKFDSILDTARKMFGRYGLSKTNIDEIARTARVAKATIYNYFGGKERVFIEVLRREVNDIIRDESQSILTERLPHNKLFAFARAKFISMRLAVNLLNLDRDESTKFLPGADKIKKEFFEKEVNIITTILKEGVESGIFYLNDIKLAAKTIAHTLKGFEPHWVLKENEERMDNYLKELIHLLFNGMAKKTGYPIAHEPKIDR